MVFKQIYPAIQRVRDFWAYVALVLLGVAALAVLLLDPVCLSEVEMPLEETDSPILLSSAENETFGQVEAQVRDLGLRAIPVLLRKVRRGEGHLGQTAMALSRLGPAALPSLISDLDDSSEGVRIVATRTIGSLGIASQAEATTIAAAFVQQLRDESDEVRYAAIIGLIRLAADWDGEAIPGLVSALQDKARLSKVDRGCLEQGAAHVFGKSGRRALTAVPELTEMLNDPTCSARHAVAAALWHISGNTNLMVPQLCAMLTETNTFARVQAAKTLRQINRDTNLSPSLLAIVNATLIQDSGNDPR